jgi:SNW domain-containing protein 1
VKATQVKHITADSQLQEPTYIKYTPQQKVANADGSGPSSRIIRVVEAPVDPLEPPKFQIRKVPRGTRV